MSVIKRLSRVFIVLISFLPLLSFAEYPGSEQNESRKLGFSELFKQNCAVCHGDELTGSAQGPALVGIELNYGDTIDQLSHSISAGYAANGMPAWSAILTPAQIRSLALYISEQRAGFSYADFNVSSALTITTDIIHSELHDFKLETVVADLDPLPFSMAPLPDGGILVTEKTSGLRIISADGKKSPLIKGTPRVYGDSAARDKGVLHGLGWLLEVALHPEYEKNGWIYLVYGDRCSDCNEISRKTKRPVSMNKIVRGRIKDGRWVDEQLIWKADIENYGLMPDSAAGGRLAFDHQGHLFFSVGIKGFDMYHGVQDLSKPWGKIHRVNDDGTIPDDNPYTETPGALKSIWCYGLRNSQGLEFDSQTGELWGTDMGPRGGDEVNLLLPGRNYGWPLTSKGVNYDGTPVEYGKILGIEFDLADIEQPVVDLTPSPAVSSFVIYRGNEFPEWKNNFLVGSLKARTLYRMDIRNGVLVDMEILVDELARIRDIELTKKGEILLLLEHASGGQILKLKKE